MIEKKEEYEALMQQVADGKYDGDGPENVAEPVPHEEDGGDLDGDGK